MASPKRMTGRPPAGGRKLPDICGPKPIVKGQEGGGAHEGGFDERATLILRRGAPIQCLQPSSCDDPASGCHEKGPLVHARADGGLAALHWDGWWGRIGRGGACSLALCSQ